MRLLPSSRGHGLLAHDLSGRAAAWHRHQGRRARSPHASLGRRQGLRPVPYRFQPVARADRTQHEVGRRRHPPGQQPRPSPEAARFLSDSLSTAWFDCGPSERTVCPHPASDDRRTYAGSSRSSGCTTTRPTTRIPSCFVGHSLCRPELSLTACPLTPRSRFSRPSNPCFSDIPFRKSSGAGRSRTAYDDSEQRGISALLEDPA